MAASQGQPTNRDQVDAPFVQANPDVEENQAGDADLVTDGSNLDIYRISTDNQFLAMNSSGDCLKHFGDCQIFDPSQNNRDGSKLFGDLRFDGNDLRSRALMDAFKLDNPRQLEKLFEALKPQEIPPEEQNARCAAAHKECYEAIAHIAAGTASASDLAQLLSAYSTLNGFAKGSFAQSYVNGAIAAVRQGMEAASRNAANPTGLTNAEVIASRMRNFQLEWDAKHRK